MFSKATEYALRATIYIAQSSGEEKKLVFRPLQKLLILRNHLRQKFCNYLPGIKLSVPHRARIGGFYITDKAKKLPVRSILKAMDEKMRQLKNAYWV